MTHRLDHVPQPFLISTLRPHRALLPSDRMKTLLAFLLSAAVSLHANGLPTSPYIYVRGQASVERKAEFVELRFALAAISSDPVKANAEVQSQAKKVFELLKTTGVADSEVIASDLESETVYEESQERLKIPAVLGYRVTRPFTVKVRTLDKYPKLVDELLALKVAEFHRVTEGVEKPDELKDAVREKAMRDARAKAEKLAKASGLKIDRVWAISPTSFVDLDQEFLGADNHPAPVGAGPDMVPEYRLAPVRVSDSLHVIFLVSEAK
jgi:uncharacterized protein YggE